MNIPLLLSRPIYSGREECGYCLGKKADPYSLEWLKQHPDGVLLGRPQSITMGFQVEQMTLDKYDAMVNSGFRRSGHFTYKPDLLRTCCRMYTIRTSLENLKVTKQHRKVCNRFKREIGGDEEDLVNSSKKGSKFSLDLIIVSQKQQASNKLLLLPRFYTRFESSDFSEEKYQLYRKYQIKVHNDDPDDVSEESFDRFLCDNPFDKQTNEEEQLQQLNEWVQNYEIGEDNNNVNSNENIKKYGKTPIRLGPTHECYYLDGKLIAISVLDFLPSGLSSIYFIWDPDYAYLSLGTISGLREILMCKYLNLGYYYLGYYISDCVKMKYKRNFGGEILDCNNKQWYPFELVDNLYKDGGLVQIGEIEGSNQLENVASLFFTDRSLYNKALDAKTDIEKKFGIPTDRQEVYSFPLVVPGLLSQEEILESLEEGKFKELRCMVVEGGSHFSPDFSRMLKKQRRIVIDLVRLLGFEIMEGSVVFT